MIRHTCHLFQPSHPRRRLSLPNRDSSNVLKIAILTELMSDFSTASTNFLSIQIPSTTHGSRALHVLVGNWYL